MFWNVDKLLWSYVQTVRWTVPPESSTVRQRLPASARAYAKWFRRHKLYTACDRRDEGGDNPSVLYVANNFWKHEEKKKSRLEKAKTPTHIELRWVPVRCLCLWLEAADADVTLLPLLPKLFAALCHRADSSASSAYGPWFKLATYVSGAYLSLSKIHCYIPPFM